MRKIISGPEHGNTGTPKPRRGDPKLYDQTRSGDEQVTRFHALSERLQGIRKDLRTHHKKLASLSGKRGVLVASERSLHQQIINTLESSEIEVQSTIATVMTDLQRRHDELLLIAAEAATTFTYAA